MTTIVLPASTVGKGRETAAAVDFARFVRVEPAKATDTAAATWAHFLFGPRWIRIDHAFVDGVRPVTTRLVRVDGTDHRALVVEIEAP